MIPITAARLEELAYHEAGHAVACFLLGCRVCEVSIVPHEEQGGDLGRCFVSAPPDWFRPDRTYLWEPRGRILLEKKIVILLAGHIAEQHLSGNRNDAGSRDIQMAMDLALCFCLSKREASAYLAWLSIRTAGMILADHAWAGLQAVAAALLAEKTLSGRRARAVYFAAAKECPPFQKRACVMATAAAKDLFALHTAIAAIAAIAQRLTEEGVAFDPTHLAEWIGTNWDGLRKDFPDVLTQARMYAMETAGHALPPWKPRPADSTVRASVEG